MSKEKTIIGIDIDGVLADYVYGLRTFVSEKLGERVFYATINITNKQTNNTTQGVILCLLQRVFMHFWQPLWPP